MAQSGELASGKKGKWQNDSMANGKCHANAALVRCHLPSACSPLATRHSPLATRHSPLARHSTLRAPHFFRC